MPAGGGESTDLPPCLDFDENLLDQRYYHGMLPRDDVLYLLKKDGDFLLRMTEADTQGARIEMVLSTLHDPTGRKRPKRNEPVDDDSVVHVIIQAHNRKYYVDNFNTFQTVNELVQFYMSHVMSIRNLKIRIKTPVTLAVWEFRVDDFVLGDVIGKTGSAEIRKGVLQKNYQNTQVAITSVTGRTPESKATIKELTRQCRLLRELHHACVVQFHGACILSQPPCFLMEFCSEGSLDAYLTRRRGKLTRDELLQMMMTSGWGLEFLHGKGIIHRDIAARNCFYDKQVVKIAGFGLARKATVYALKGNRRVSIRWSAPEAVSTFRFTQKSDVYSFGVLIYEIFSQKEPYEGLSNQEIKPFIMEGRVCEFPATTPKQLVEYILDNLWQQDAEKRPKMENVMEWLTNYTGIKMQMNSTGTGTPIIHQNFTALVLHDVPYKDVQEEQKPATATTPTGKVKPRSRKTRTPTKRSLRSTRATKTEGTILLSTRERTKRPIKAWTPVKVQPPLPVIPCAAPTRPAAPPVPPPPPVPVRRPTSPIAAVPRAPIAPVVLTKIPKRAKPKEAEYENLADIQAEVPLPPNIEEVGSPSPPVKRKEVSPSPPFRQAEIRPSPPMRQADISPSPPVQEEKAARPRRPVAVPVGRRRAKSPPRDDEQPEEEPGAVPKKADDEKARPARVRAKSPRREVEQPEEEPPMMPKKADEEKVRPARVRAKSPRREAQAPDEEPTELQKKADAEELRPERKARSPPARIRAKSPLREVEQPEEEPAAVPKKVDDEEVRPARVRAKSPRREAQQPDEEPTELQKKANAEEVRLERKTTAHVARGKVKSPLREDDDEQKREPKEQKGVRSPHRRKGSPEDIAQKDVGDVSPSKPPERESAEVSPVKPSPNRAETSPKQPPQGSDEILPKKTPTLSAEIPQKPRDDSAEKQERKDSKEKPAANVPLLSMTFPMADPLEKSPTKAPPSPPAKDKKQKPEKDTRARRRSDETTEI
ncbi:hypothetical protein Q1695_005832 [Nippostrongylus brasiliensis]|nr:hypothetical protein Q1695_005832 [Nippostrongylus brasiliensis]